MKVPTWEKLRASQIVITDRIDVVGLVGGDYICHMVLNATLLGDYRILLSMEEEVLEEEVLQMIVPLTPDWVILPIEVVLDESFIAFWVKKKILTIFLDYFMMFLHRIFVVYRELWRFFQGLSFSLR